VRTTTYLGGNVTNLHRLLGAAVLFCVVLLSGCAAGPPVQEMSDARQAISAAREAGAADHAAGDLREAEDYLDSAVRNISRKDYDQARDDAVEAKNKALAALATTESAVPDQPNR
jgi:PBP1b-binding outer membrane lipoprotein LpoB